MTLVRYENLLKTREDALEIGIPRDPVARAAAVIKRINAADLYIIQKANNPAIESNANRYYHLRTINPRITHTELSDILDYKLETASAEFARTAFNYFASKGDNLSIRIMNLTGQIKDSQIRQEVLARHFSDIAVKMVLRTLTQAEYESNLESLNFMTAPETSLPMALLMSVEADSLRKQ